jgi:hypothetical protein
MTTESMFMATSIGNVSTTNTPNHSLVFGTGGSNRLTISSNGLVGLGNSNMKTSSISLAGENAKISTDHGDIVLKDLIEIMVVMRKLIMDMSTDEDINKKYPYLRETAQSWILKELRK